MECHDLTNFLEIEILYNYEGTCQYDCEYGLTLVTYYLSNEYYCDATCNAIEQFIDSTTLYNNRGVCQDSCIYGTEAVLYFDGAEKFCDLSCHAMNEYWTINEEFYNKEGICLTSCEST